MKRFEIAMKILITGFGPFDKFPKNPAEITARSIAEAYDDMKCSILPVIYGEARKALMKDLEEKDPDVVISLGLNANIGCINLEELAVNILGSEVADNSGKVLFDTPIIEGGELAYRTGLPTASIKERLRADGIPAKHSYSAGVYLCNEVFYTEMAWAFEKDRIAGFIHIPMASELIADRIEMYRHPHMSLEMIEKACRIIVDEVVRSLI
jgi:pyroglutamyl-peptidase